MAEAGAEPEASVELSRLACRGYASSIASSIASSWSRLGLSHKVNGNGAMLARQYHVRADLHAQFDGQVPSRRTGHGRWGYSDLRPQCTDEARTLQPTCTETVTYYTMFTSINN